MKTCDHCGAILARRDDEQPCKWVKRVTCGQQCAAKKARATQLAKQEARAAALVEDIEWIIDTDSPVNVAHRVGYVSVETLTRFLRRQGMHGLADRLLSMELAA